MIGIFDSGYGGLTVLRALADKLPQYSYIYFGDNAHAPYGNRSPEEIIEYTKRGIEFLFARGAKLVLLGCNTASAAALRPLQQDWLSLHYPDRRLLGIVVPTIEQITGADWRHETPITTPISAEMFTVGVLATPATVASEAYPREIHKRNRSLQVVQQACPTLVELIEQNASEGEITEQVQRSITELLAQANGTIHAVLLGCTHFELIADIITQALPAGVRLYHQPSMVAESLAHYLKRHPSLVENGAANEKSMFFTSADPQDVSAIASRYFGKKVQFAVQ